MRCLLLGEKPRHHDKVSSVNFFDVAHNKSEAQPIKGEMRQQDTMKGFINESRTESLT